MKAVKPRNGKARASRTKRGGKAASRDGALAAVVAAALVALAVFASLLALVFRPGPIDDADAAFPQRPPEYIDPSAPPSLPPETRPVPVEIPSVPPVAAPEQPAARQPTESRPAARQPTEKLPETKPAVPRPVPAARPASPPERQPRPRPRSKGVAVIVIDDAGNNLRELTPFLRFPGPLTIAVLPGLPHSAEAARRARAAGKEVILHQPMEAVGGQNPGPGAISTGMNEAEIRAILSRNVEEIGPVVGMNNHQGSKVTADERTMKIVLDFCRERGLFFLDSRTTAESVVPAVAAGMGMSVRERDVFVDNIQERAAMIRYLQEGLHKAEKKGSAVMIGHAWSSELASTLQELYPELLEQGFSLSSIARIMMGTYDDEGLGD